MSAALLCAALNDPYWLRADRRRHQLPRPELEAVAEACTVCDGRICWMAPEACITPARHAALFSYDPALKP